MTSVYVTNVVKKVTVSPGAAGGSGGTGTNLLPLNNSWTGTNLFSNAVTAQPSSPSTVPITVKGASGQSSSLSQWRDSSNNILAEVDSIGQISTAANVYVGRGTTSGGGNKVLVLASATPPTSNAGTGAGILYSDSGSLKYRDSSGAIYVPVPLSGSKGEILAHTGTGWVKVPAGLDGEILSADSGQNSGVDWITPSGSGHTIQNPAGSSLTPRTNLQFTGGVTVTDDSGNNRTIVSISGSGSSMVIKNSGATMTARSALNFGTGFSLADDAGNDEIDISVPSNAAAGTPSLRSLGSGSTNAAAGNHTHTGVYAASNVVTVHEARTDDPHVAAGYITQTYADGLYAPASFVPDSPTNGYFLQTDGAGNTSWATGTGGGISAPYTLIGAGSGTTPMTIQGVSGQSVPLFRIEDNTTSHKFSVDQSGRVSVGGSFSMGGMIKTVADQLSRKGIVSRRFSNTTAGAGNLFEGQDEGGNAVFSVDAAGNVAGTNIGAKVIVVDTVNDVPGGTPDGTVVLVRA
jgi:hypothetical protein